MYMFYISYIIYLDISLVIALICSFTLSFVVIYTSINLIRGLFKEIDFLYT